MHKFKFKKTCRNCGIEMELRQSQVLKKVCPQCAYNRKKLQASERYWAIVSPGSVRHNYFKNLLKEMDKRIKEKGGGGM